MKIFQSILCIMLLGISVASWGQEKKAYRLFDANGKEVGYREMMKVLKNQDVVFLGEVHNLSLIHIWQMFISICGVVKTQMPVFLASISWNRFIWTSVLIPLKKVIILSLIHIFMSMTKRFVMKNLFYSPKVSGSGKIQVSSDTGRMRCV